MPPVPSNGDGIASSSVLSAGRIKLFVVIKFPNTPHITLQNPQKPVEIVQMQSHLVRFLTRGIVFELFINCIRILVTPHPYSVHRRKYLAVCGGGNTDTTFEFSVC
jgi:hypothetical protein